MKNVVVGVDGTAVSLAALRWAADAVGTDGHIRAVAATLPKTTHQPVDSTRISPNYVESLRETLESSWTAPVRGRVRAIETRALAGRACDVLVEQARDSDAEAIVVGAHAPALGWPRTVGSTIRHLVRALPCPLVVVPEQNRHRLGDDDPIIVGVGHGPATNAAVHWAAGLAEAYDAPLGLVRVTGEGPVFQVDGLLELVAYYVDPAKRLEWAAEDVAELALAAQRATRENIVVSGATMPGLPATQLAKMSGAASLLVIGKHLPLLPGATHIAQPLRFELTHARCPVAVVPYATEPAERPGG